MQKQNASVLLITMNFLIIIADQSDSVMKKFTVNNRPDAHSWIINSSVCPLIDNEKLANERARISAAVVKHKRTFTQEGKDRQKLEKIETDSDVVFENVLA